MEKYNYFQKAYKFIEKVLGGLICILLSALVIVVLISVLSRYFLNFSIAWGEELSRFMLIWMVFSGAVIAYSYNEHLGLDVLVKVVPEKVSHIIMIIANLLILIAVGLIINGGSKLTIESIDSFSPALAIPYGYVYIIIPICGVMLLFQTISNLMKHLKLLVSFKAEGSKSL